MTTETPITQAQAPDTFDVLSFLEGTAYPTETVKVYTDALSASELMKLNDKRLKMDEAEETQDYTEIDARIEELRSKVESSILVFSLRGMPPGLVQEIYTVANGEDATEEETLEAENKLIANTIVNVETGAGVRDPRLWDGEAVSKLRHYLKEAEFGKLVTGVVNVNFNASVFDQATDAGFLGRGSDVE